MMLRLATLLLCTTLLSCRHNTGALQPQNPDQVRPETEAPREEPDTLEKKMVKTGLVNIQEILPGVLVDLKYSSTDNFLQTDVYGGLDHAYLQPDVAEKLKQAYANLKEVNPGLTFLVYDAARPLSVQKKMWEIVNMPGSEKSKYVSNPAQHSIHNYGAAIDLTLCDTAGTPLDMGTPYDYFGDLAQPVFEARFLNDGKLTQYQLENRKLLRTVMQKAGFRQLPTEWWHYNSCSRETAKIKYRLIE